MRRQLVGLVVLQVLDLWTTWRGLGMGAVEGNPVGQAALASGFSFLVVAKLAGTLLVVCIGWLLWSGSDVNKRQAVVGLQVGCAFMVAVVGWNSWVLFLHA